MLTHENGWVHAYGLTLFSPCSHEKRFHLRLILFYNAVSTYTQTLCLSVSSHQTTGYGTTDDEER